MLHAPICPRNTCAIISGRNVRRYSIAQAAFQRLRHQHYAACCDTAFACIPARCRHAKLLRSVSDASCTPSTPGTDALNILRRPPIDKRCWRCNSATAAQHQRSSLRHSICLHPSMMPQCKAAAECLRCFMRPFALETHALSFLDATCADTASLKWHFSGCGTSTHAALCDTAFACI